MLFEAASACKTFLLSPTRAARDCRAPRILTPCVVLYVLATAGFMVLFWLKPFDFPDADAAVPREMRDLGYWLKAELWQPLLEAGWIVFLLGLLRYFRRGSWPVRLASAVLWTAVPFIVLAAYAQARAFPKPALAAATAAWMALFIPLLKEAGREDWCPIVNFSLGANAIAFPLLAALGIATAAGRAEAFKALQILGGLWLLGAMTLGARELSGLRLPRAFMAVVLSAFMQFALAFSLHFLGAEGVLKALLYG